MTEFRLPGMSARLLDGPEELKAAIVARAPDFAAAAHGVSVESGRTVPVMFEAVRWLGSERSTALSMILVQLSNDTQDLLFELLAGRGRSGLRCARSLIELAVAAHDVAASDEAALRYAQFESIAELNFAALDAMEALFDRAELRSHRHTVRKIRREHEPLAAAAIDEYGSQFRRQWATANLHDRAQAHSLDVLYAFYRVASQPVHGSAGGVVGLRRVTVASDTYRTGPALGACVIAAVYGLKAVLATLDAYAPVVRDDALARLRSAISRLQAQLPTYRRAISDLDAEIWPDHRPANLGILVVLGKEIIEPETWLAFPETFEAAEYSGDFRMSEEHSRVLNILSEKVLPRYDLERVGVLLVEVEGIDFGRADLDRMRPLDSVIPSTPFEIWRDGDLAVPSDFEAAPYVDDILRGLSLPRRDG